MFTSQELVEIMQESKFLADFSSVRQSLVNWRLRQPVLFDSGSEDQLARFAEAVLASAPDWTRNERLDICKAAAEITEALAARDDSSNRAKRFRIRTALLYELAELPALSSSALQDDDLSQFLLAFFRRTGPFASLNQEFDEQTEFDTGGLLAGELALLDDALQFATGVHQDSPRRLSELKTRRASSAAWQIGRNYDLGLTASEIHAFSVLIVERIERATITNVHLHLTPLLRKMAFPAELLPAQRAAVEGGLLNSKNASWGFAAPTGSGKTFLARLAIADVVHGSRDSKVIYLVPSKALVSEVATALGNSLSEIDCQVIALSAQLVDLDEEEKTQLDDASVVVMTPEKADMLLRLGAEFLQSVTLAVIDEAHHIESGTRGALLEMYLWRLKRLLPNNCRFVFLSAVAPNIEAIARWIDPKGSAVTYSHRPTRMRVGIYKIHGSGKNARGSIHYADNTSIEVISGGAETNIRRGICELAEFMLAAGPVLVVAKSKRECEEIAIELKKWLEGRGHLSELSPEDQISDSYRSLDASLEREMYSDVELRQLVKHRIAYHHAGLPPSVRNGVEQAIRKRQIDYVIATTTLAEGVNFPFSSVIVQTLALKEPPDAGRPSRYSPITPRTFWNIAGRAGRPGFDAEGQVILFEPSLGLEKIEAVLDQYLQPGITSLAPVQSALATALEEIEDELKEKNYTADQLSNVRLPEKMSRRARGAVNVLRVGLMHAYAEGLVASPEEMLDSSFAAQFLSEQTAIFSRTVMQSQGLVIQTYLNEDDVPTIDKLAELGLSLETLNELRDYVRRMKDWQISNCERLFVRGWLNLSQAQYIVGPVAKRMTELEGRALGGALSDVIIHWLSGVTFTSIRSASEYSQRLEDLIAVIYSRVQFLLPWGLWATDWIIEQEASRRGINYDGQVKRLAYLADAGVPSFDALKLFHLGFERVDATRLSKAYTDAGGLRSGMDCTGWMLSQSRESLERAIRGQDSRRLAHRFFDRIDAMRKRIG